MEIAAILSMDHMATSSNPTCCSSLTNWDVAADNCNALGAIADREGIKLYTENHDSAADFLLDGGPLDDPADPQLGIRKLEYFLGHRPEGGLAGDGHLLGARRPVQVPRVHRPRGATRKNVFDPAGLVARNNRRYPLFHAKDSIVSTTNGMGYDMVPFGTGVIDYTTFFSPVGQRNYHNPMVEDDNSPSATDPAQSLRKTDQLRRSGRPAPTPPLTRDTDRAAPSTYCGRGRPVRAEEGAPVHPSPSGRGLGVMRLSFERPGGCRRATNPAKIEMLPARLKAPL
ncbi:hypothetical protein SVIOM342S_01358 [Streptomyces violaceorubidus]